MRTESPAFGLELRPTITLDEDHALWFALAFEAFDEIVTRDRLRLPAGVSVTFAGVKQLARRHAAARRVSAGVGNSSPSGGNDATVSKMTTGQVAGALGQSNRRVIQLLEEGRLSGERDVRGHWQIDRHSVLAYMSRRGVT